MASGSGRSGIGTTAVNGRAFGFEALAFVETIVDTIQRFDMIDLEIRQSSQYAI